MWAGRPEQVLVFWERWNLGIHSYLAYVRDRLVVARGLLAGAGIKAPRPCGQDR